MDARSRRLVGVYGNNDGPPLRARLPEVARADLDGLRFAVVHETGPAAGREARCAARFPDTDVLVFGHCHIPWDTIAAAGLRLLNPGSPTDRRRQPHATYMTATVAEGTLSDVELHAIETNLTGSAPVSVSNVSSDDLRGIARSPGRTVSRGRPSGRAGSRRAARWPAC